MELTWTIVVSPSPYQVFSNGQLGVVKDYLLDERGELLDVFPFIGETLASKLLRLMSSGETTHTSRVIVPLPDGTFTVRVLSLLAWRNGSLVEKECKTEVRTYVSVDNQRVTFKGEVAGITVDVPVGTHMVKALRLAKPMDEDILIETKVSEAKIEA